MPAGAEKVIFAVTIYEAEARKQNFGQVSNAFIRAVDAASNTEIMRFDLSEDYAMETAVIFGELYRLSFYGYLWERFSKEWADLYLAGYFLEKSLSVDNLMVFMAIFASFGIKSGMQHRILYWGIVGALVFRAMFVMIGTSLFMASPWVGFVFAAFVAWSGVQMLRGGGDDDEIEDYSDHWSVRLTGRLMPIYTKLHFDRFFIKHRKLLVNGLENSVTRNGPVYATPAFLCLATIETSDIAFSFDSVPAVISITQDPLLVYAAMIFAILGLRSRHYRKQW